MAAGVSSLTLEAYMTIHEALTKGNPTVQPLTPVEEPFFKVQDLRQVLLLHGLNAGKFVRHEVLQQLAGATLINPCLVHAPEAGPQQGTDAEPPASDAAPAAAALPFGAADLAALGWAQVNALLDAALQAPAFMDLLPSMPALASAEQHGGQQHQQQQQAAQQEQQEQQQRIARVEQQQRQHMSAAATVPAHHAAEHANSAASAPVPADTVPAVMQLNAQNPHLQQLQLQNHLLQQQLQMLQALQQQQAGHQMVQWPLQAQSMLATLPLLPGTMMPAHIQPVASAQHLAHINTAGPSSSTAQPVQGAGAVLEHNTIHAAAADAAQLASDSLHAGPTCSHAVRPSPAAATQQQDELPVFEHTPWLHEQLESFGAQQGCGPSMEELGGAGAAALSGRRVAFLLLDALEVAGPKKQALPPGIYQGRAVKYLGQACRPEVCEAGCAGAHEYFNARVIPPPDGPAADIAAGRPVELLLDLQPRYRVNALQALLRLSHDDLQDAWLLLKHKDNAPAPALPEPELQDVTAPTQPSAKRAAGSLAPAGRGRGRGRGSKRNKTT